MPFGLNIGKTLNSQPFAITVTPSTGPSATLPANGSIEQLSKFLPQITSPVSVQAVSTSLNLVGGISIPIISNTNATLTFNYTGFSIFYTLIDDNGISGGDIPLSTGPSPKIPEVVVNGLPNTIGTVANAVLTPVLICCRRDKKHKHKHKKCKSHK